MRVSPPETRILFNSYGKTLYLEYYNNVSFTISAVKPNDTAAFKELSDIQYSWTYAGRDYGSAIATIKSIIFE